MFILWPDCHGLQQAINMEFFIFVSIFSSMRIRISVDDIFWRAFSLEYLQAVCLDNRVILKKNKMSRKNSCHYFLNGIGGRLQFEI